MPEFRDPPDVVQASRPLAVRERSRSKRGLATTVGNGGVVRLLASARVQRAGETAAQRLDESVARAIEERRGRGRPLGDSVRADMETSLGQDLSEVRVHTDGTAHELNKAVSARAFTTGNDVFFKQGTYNPGSSSGRELLAHELTHVVQQRTGTSGLGPGEVSQPSDAAEQHAADVGRTVAHETAAPAAATASGTAGIFRQDEPEENEEAIAGAWETTQRQADDEDLAPDDESG